MGSTPERGRDSGGDVLGGYYPEESGSTEERNREMFGEPEITLNGRIKNIREQLDYYSACKDRLDYLMDEIRKTREELRTRRIISDLDSNHNATVEEMYHSVRRVLDGFKVEFFDLGPDIQHICGITFGHPYVMMKKGEECQHCKKVVG
jgi:regulator of replication initiation timing